MGMLYEFGPEEAKHLAGLPVDPKALSEELTRNLPKPQTKADAREEVR